jgi:hypothetical protein
MAITIVQTPLYNILPIGQQIIFAISEPTIVADKFKVKFVAQIFVSDKQINLSSDTPIGTFKTTPNNEGVGIFDLRPILETFVKPDNEGSTFGNGSRYKQATSIPKAEAVTHPIHLIDKIAVSENAIRFFAINFFVEYSDTETGDVIDFTTLNPEPTESYIMFNGVLQYDDVLTLDKANYGYDLSANDFYLISGYDKYLTNAPRIQNARLTDYGTLPFFNFLPLSTNKVNGFVFTYYHLGVQVGTETVTQNWTRGGSSSGNLTYIDTRLMYLGAFPANLRNWSTMFQALVTAGTIDQYIIKPTNSLGYSIAPYTIDIICPNERGYEGIRLTWLNQWGTWDYYTFNMKSTRSIKTKRIPYTQLGGTWNDSTFKISGYKGGKKNFRVNSTEKIKLNTDFVNEAEGVWFEELINSPEVYIVNGFSEGDDTATMTNKYIDPVTLTTSSYVKKTIANDKLMQYTIEIEKSKMKRTQAV